MAVKDHMHQQFHLTGPRSLGLRNRRTPFLGSAPPLQQSPRLLRGLPPAVFVYPGRSTGASSWVGRPPVLGMVARRLWLPGVGRPGTVLGFVARQFLGWSPAVFGNPGSVDRGQFSGLSPASSWDGRPPSLVTRGRSTGSASACACHGYVYTPPFMAGSPTLHFVSARGCWSEPTWSARCLSRRASTGRGISP